MSSEAVVTSYRSSLLNRLLDRFAGFDFFVSYAHADTSDYAAALVEQLRRCGFKAFLDKQVYVAGDDLNTATERRIRASSKLVVVVGREALKSRWVLQEVEAAMAANRPVIAIDLLGDLSVTEQSSPLAERLRDRIHIRESGGLSAIQPAEQTLQALTRSFQATRREALRLRVASAATLFFAVLAGFSYWQKNVADEQRGLAVQQRQLADNRAEQYRGLCNDIVEQVTRGQAKIDGLRTSSFGGLIADITDTLAQLPDPEKDLNCEPVEA